MGSPDSSVTAEVGRWVREGGGVVVWSQVVSRPATYSAVVIKDSGGFDQRRYGT